MTDRPTTPRRPRTAAQIHAAALGHPRQIGAPGCACDIRADDERRAFAEAAQEVVPLDHDINCGIDALRQGEDIGCTCYVRFEEAAPIAPPGIDPATGMRYRPGDDPIEGASARQAQARAEGLPDLLRDDEGRFINPVTGQPVPPNWQQNLERQYEGAAPRQTQARAEGLDVPTLARAIHEGIGIPFGKPGIYIGGYPVDAHEAARLSLPSEEEPRD